MRGERADHTLDPTALVHEAWLRMKDVGPGETPDAGGFRALAGKLLRQILVDHARKRGAAKRQRAGERVAAEGLVLSTAGVRGEVLDLERALAELAARDPRRARVVELRFFGGLSVAETARELEVSEDTVKRDWRLARAWLNRELGKDGAEE